MKKTIEEYKNEIKSLVTNPKYIIPIIFAAILSYGFAITHYSIGVDDLCFDRYISGTYILSAKRWGTWLLYNILNIKEFTPFWLEFIVSTFMVIIAIILSAFLKKHLKNKMNIWGCVIFSSIFISNPIINHFFMYQSTNLAVVISNLLMIISAILIMENYFGNKKIGTYIISTILITISLSMYESCAQTYLVVIFISIFIKLINKEEKNLFKFLCTSIGCLIIGILGYLITGKITLLILEKLGKKEPNYARTLILSIDKRIWAWSDNIRLLVWKRFFYNLLVKIMYDIKHYYPFIAFIIFSLIALISEMVKSYIANKNGRLITMLLIIFSNLILIIMQVEILYRIQFSWILTTAFLVLYIYKIFENKKILKYIINVVIVFLIIFQTRNLNQIFYEDYKRYEKEKTIANEIAMDIIKETDYENKPIAYSKILENMDQTNNEDIKSIINWGNTAFKEMGTEINKFINSFGYNFLSISKEEYDQIIELYEILDEETKNKKIIELQDYIIVNLEKY